MVNIVDGNLLDAKEDIIVHQVNCQGAMGSGVALAIRERWPLVYKWYMKRCNTMKSMNMSDKLLGECHWCQVDGKLGEKKWIVNLFGQFEYASRGKPGKQYTDYYALRKGLNEVKLNAEWYHNSVAMPWGIGCGRGGGDWEGVVKPMILDIFEKSDVEVTLYRL